MKPHHYEQVYLGLKAYLEDHLEAPSEAELMARFCVGRNTVRRAVARLRTEGRVITGRGVRTRRVGP